MAGTAKMSAFAKYAWFTLGYNVLVIVWGVFLRASKSGDGCGEHWLTCNGELIPSAPQFKTVIEFSHRMTTAIDGIIMLILLVWAIKIFLRSRSTQNRQVLYAAIGSFFFVITEAAVGAGLVLTGNVAEAITDVRPFWAMGHLINTFILLTFLTLTAWFATRERRVSLKNVDTKTAGLIVLGVLGLLAVGLSGSLAALSSMLFPSQTLAEGVAKDFSETSSTILRLRLSHPILSIVTSVYLIFLAGWLKAKSEDATVGWWSNALSLLVIGQVIFGGATLLTLGPIIMQLGHLLLADAVWIAFVLLVASYLNAGKRLA